MHAYSNETRHAFQSQIAALRIPSRLAIQISNTVISTDSNERVSRRTIKGEITGPMVCCMP
jgi:hypothetical protein